MTDNSCTDCHTEGRIDHLRQGRKLEYFTIGWNMVEAAVAVGAAKMHHH